MLMPDTILLLKSQSDEGQYSYEELFRSKGLSVSQVQPIQFEFKNLDKLRASLQDADKYRGLILSSPRCVEAVYKTGGSLIKSWKEKNNYAVGERTYQDALNKLELVCKGKESGNSEKLAEFIINLEGDNGEKPFLFPHGNLKTDTLNDALGKVNISMENVLVYDTVSNVNLEKDFTTVTNGFKNYPEFLIFFSPSGFKMSLPYLRKMRLSDVKIIAIGPVTEEAILKENLKVDGVASKPTPEECLKIVESLRR